MSDALALLIMSASYFGPGFALSSHFDSDGVPLSELSWSSSLAVVAVSFSGLFTFIFLMLACLCCKKGEIGFKEFENAEGDEYQADMSKLASPTSAGSPDVYVLPLTEVSLPLAKQPGRSVQLLKSADTTRHSLLYIKEIGHGWFGKVLLGEVTSGLSNTQVVVKELKTSASVQDQMHFLAEAQSYRSLQHPALVQCLAQCTEVMPYLLVMEFCPLGDVKGYLRSCRAADSMTPDHLLLQRMASQIASGLLHLHKHDFVHSDLALRNCFLTSDVTVKIGDYGLAQSKYKDDYFVTSDQSCIPLRWISPELVDEVHGNLLVAEQTKQSNIWSLGVTIWELFELGNQPYRHYSDRQVLSYAVKEQQLKLPKPQFQFPLAERWYEVMQFCWLQPDQRPNAEEVHLLLSYLCAKGASEAEEEFERRWKSMRPNTNHGCLQGAGPRNLDMLQTSATSSSFPLLEQFSAGDGYQSESGDDILTVTETSHGLNFEYKWEQARAKQPYNSSSTTGALGQVNPLCQEIYYPPGGMVGGCGIDELALGVSPQYYDPSQLHTPGVVPVLSAHSPSVNSEYYIRIEEPVECNIDMDYTLCTYSPEFRGSTGSFLTSGGDLGDCMECPSKGKPIESYWSADIHKRNAYDSDSSPTISLTMEPLLGQVSDSSPLRPWESGHYVSYKDRDGGYYYEHSPPLGMEHYLKDPSEPLRESWGSRSLRKALGELEDPLGISPSLGSPPHAYNNPYLESTPGSVIENNLTGGYYDMMGSLRKIMPGNHAVCIDMESGGAVFVGQDDSESEEEEDLFVERQAMAWTSNNPSKNNMSTCQSQGSSRKDAYADFHYTMPMTDVEDAWPKQHSLPYRSAKPQIYPDTRAKSNTCPIHGRHASVSSAECSSYIHLCPEPREAEVYPVPCCQALSNSHFVDPLTGSLVRNSFMNDSVSDKSSGLPNRNQQLSQNTLPIGSKSELTKNNVNQEGNPDMTEYIGTSVREEMHKQDSTVQQDPGKITCKPEVMTVVQQVEEPLVELISTEPESDRCKLVDSGIDGGHLSLMETDNCSDEDITDVTSGIFGDFHGDSAETADYATPSFKSLQKQVGTPDSMDSIDIPSTTDSSETLSPTPLHPSNSPRAMDSGYDTENNESPEFVLKEPHEPQDNKPFLQPLGLSVSDACPTVNIKVEEKEMEYPQQDEVEAETVLTSPSTDGRLNLLTVETPYRDSAYFSDSDVSKEKESEDKEEPFVESHPSKGEEDIEVTFKDGSLLTQINERDDETSNIPNSEENSESIRNVNEETQIHLLLEPDESVFSSSPETSIITHTLPEVSPTNDTVQDNGLESNSKNSQEISFECQTSDLTSSEFSDITQEDDDTMETSTIVPTEPLMAISPEGNVDVDTFDNSYTDANEHDNDTEVTKEVTSNTCSEELPAPANSDNAEMPVSDMSVEEPVAKENNTKDEVQCYKTSNRPSSPPPLPPRDEQLDDEEDRDSDDSDESDEELRTYSIQEQSEESDDEVLLVPIIVSDCSDAHKLRSVLRMPSLFTDSLCDNMESKKKVVSFFDDVTVYLFDQESPTSELAEHAFPLGEDTSTTGGNKESTPQEKVNISDDSSDGNISEESAGYEWEDDFTLPPLATRSKESPPDIKPSLSSTDPNSKPVVQFSRFTVSPSSISRFSITHISDSEMDSAGGSSEDGERE